jgi:hypothetical protein
LAVVALVVGPVLLFQPIPSSTLSCPTAFWQVLGQTPSGTFHPPRAIASAKRYGDPVAACKSAASDREHIIEALGIGAVVLVGLSFLPRRRPVVTVSVDPSLL